MLKKNSHIILLALSLAFVACTPRAPASQPDASKVQPGPGFGDAVETGPMVAPPGSSLRAIDGSAGNDVWAVGEVHTEIRQRSLVEHWDGSSWSVVDVPNVGALGDVSVLSPDDVWAVSYSSVIHWDGTAWDATELSKGNARSLTSISATAPDDVWVAGERPGFKVGPNTNGWSTLVMHYDGQSWSEEDTPDQGSRNNYLHGVEALSPTDVWAAGYSEDVGPHTPEGTTLAIHWDGKKWSLVPPPNPSRSLNIIWGMGQGGGSTVWSLGDYRDADRHLTPLILEWTGTSWRQLPLRGYVHWSATSAAGASHGHTWVVGSEPTSSFAVALCDVSECRTEILPDGDYNMHATSVWALSDTDAWLVGTRSAKDGTTTPVAKHWDGSAWTDIAVPSGVQSTPIPS